MLIYIFEGKGRKENTEKDNKFSENNLLKEIEMAKSEWEYSLKRFNDVSDPDVVDYIVYYIIASERRYMYLLNKYRNIYENKKIRKEQISTEDNND